MKNKNVIRVALLNTYDIKGGAAIASFRLHRALNQSAIDSKLLVQYKDTDDLSVLQNGKTLNRLIDRARPYLDSFPVRFYENRKRELFSTAVFPDSLLTRLKAIAPDIIHLFWVAGGFLRIETIASFNKPIVWTLHDMWPMTGGCHYDDECRKFQLNCGSCPVLGSNNYKDLSYRILNRKIASWRGVPMTIVATSNWLADMAKSSAVFKDKNIVVIPNGIDTEKYKPVDQNIAREVWNLPKNKKLILFSAFGATIDKRKGNQFLIPALKKLALQGWGEHAELVVLGASSPKNPVDLGMKTHYMGYLSDEISQVLLYSAVNLTVAPSMQENLSNTVMESLSCGTPVVAFNIGGMPDLITHQHNGYLAKPFNEGDLAAGMEWVIENNENAELSRFARKSVLDKYQVAEVAQQYISLYESLLV